MSDDQQGPDSRADEEDKMSTGNHGAAGSDQPAASAGSDQPAASTVRPHPAGDAMQVRGVLGLLRARETIALVVSTIALATVRFVNSDFVWLPDLARQTLMGWFGLNLVMLFIVPLVIGYFVLGMKPADLGVRIGNWRVSVRYALIYGGITIPLILISSRWGDFQAYYSRYLNAGQPAAVIALLMAGWLVYFLAWEFHFRGFLLFALERRFGAWWAIIIQTVPFTLMHIGKPWSETTAAVVAGIALGWWAYRSRSCLGPWLLHWVCSGTMQFAVAFWPRNGG
ncbi:MAG TPA: type II CAAX endopeptidase family protein [Armatimonadota bacterium]|nr:type II CAAX endopeptidase family protein [Armatimonadota bacterium]